MKQQTISRSKKTYRWSGINSEGKKRHGEIDAMSLNLAKAYLLQQGITAPLIAKKYYAFQLKRQKISLTEIAIFYRQLATLIKAGIPLAQALHILSQHQEHTLLQTLIQSLKNELEVGQTLSHGLRKHTRYFDELTCHLIYVAEETGTLDIMLTRISHYKEHLLSLKNKLQQALFYPGMIMLVAMIVSLTMIIFIVPRFAELFANFHAELPTFTLMIVHFSDLMRQDYWLLSIPILMSYGGYIYYKKHPPLKNAIHRLLFKIPNMGALLKKFILARFARTLATVLFAGMPITDALKILVNISRNTVVRTAIMTLQLDIATGLRLHQAMQINPLFPAMMTQMIQVGEESGSLDAMLEKIAEFYESEIDYWLKNFSNILEPLIIIILGVLIGGLVIAMYLPIFKLGTVI
jgi:type IV pilus assembly protein PilC